MDEAGETLASRREKILGEESLAKLILALSIPLFISGSVQSLYNIADTYWLSKLGPAALGTPTVSWPYRGILMSLGFGLASSVSALVGQYIGAKDYRSASRSLGGVLGLLLSTGSAGFLIFYLARGLYIDVTNVTPEMKGLVDPYIEVTLAGTPFIYLYLTFNFALGAVGDTMTPMKVSVVATTLNFVLDPMLIFWAGLGVVGAAIATLLSNIATGLYAAHSFSTGRHGLRVRLSDLAPDPRLLKLIAKISGPIIASRLMTTLGFMVMIGIVNGLGTPVVAAYSIGQVVLNIDHIISFPIARSTGIVVAQSLGARFIERSKKAVKTGLLLLLASIGIYILCLIVFRGRFISVFTSEASVRDPANHMLLIFGPSVLGFDLFIFANSVARSSGYTFFVSALGIGRLWLLRIPLSWLLAYYLSLGDTGLWTGMSISNWIVGIAAVTWVLSWRWAKPIIHSPPRIPRAN